MLFGSPFRFILEKLSSNRPKERGVKERSKLKMCIHLMQLCSSHDVSQNLGEEIKTKEWGNEQKKKGFQQIFFIHWAAYSFGIVELVFIVQLMFYWVKISRSIQNAASCSLAQFKIIHLKKYISLIFKRHPIWPSVQSLCFLFPNHKSMRDVDSL